MASTFRNITGSTVSITPSYIYIYRGNSPVSSASYIAHVGCISRPLHSFRVSRWESSSDDVIRPVSPSFAYPHFLTSRYGVWPFRAFFFFFFFFVVVFFLVFFETFAILDSTKTLPLGMFFNSMVWWGDLSFLGEEGNFNRTIFVSLSSRNF